MCHYAKLTVNNFSLSIGLVLYKYPSQITLSSKNAICLPSHTRLPYTIDEGDGQANNFYNNEHMILCSDVIHYLACQGKRGKMEEQAKPRVNGATIAKFIGKRVTIVGRYVSVSAIMY